MMRKRVLRSTSVCAICSEIIDSKLRPICRRVDTAGFTVANAHEIPTICGPECDKSHGRKPNPFSGSLDHVIPVSKLPPGSPLLTDPKNARACHLVCNISRGNRDDKPQPRCSKDWFS